MMMILPLRLFAMLQLVLCLTPSSSSSQVEAFSFVPIRIMTTTTTTTHHHQVSNNDVVRYQSTNSGSTYSSCSVFRARRAMTGTMLFSQNNENNNGNEVDDDTLGTSRGIILLGIVFLINVWLFSIPTELRRNKFCSEEQVMLYPESKCITFDTWVNEITSYHSNGGGIQFDFTIEGK